MKLTANGMDFVQLSPQLFDRTLGEAVAELVRQRYPNPKALARAWRIEVGTAENVWRGHASTRSLGAAVVAEGWQFIEALGSTVTGETYEQYQERLVDAKLKELADAQQTVIRIRSRREALERSAALHDPVQPGQGAQQNG